MPLKAQSGDSNIVLENKHETRAVSRVAMRSGQGRQVGVGRRVKAVRGGADLD